MNPRCARLVGLLLGVACFSLALALQPWSGRLQQDRTGGVLAMLLGDGRRLFANHVFVKADAYFHRGVYPSIFDGRRAEDPHLLEAGWQNHEHEHDHDHDHDHDCDHGWLDHARQSGQRWDWIAWMNRSLRPTAHVHLGGGEERELLPWLRLAAELDPNNPQNFALPAYWLRRQLGKVDEAEQFLRLGLRHNPGDPALLFELGLLLLDNREDFERARNVLELAWARWLEREAPAPSPDELLAVGILARLARIAEHEGDLDRAIGWLQRLELMSPQPEAIRQQILELQERTGSGGVAP
jgi:tetratricopeptide (TPR) repeat protein